MNHFLPSLAKIHKEHEADLSVSYPRACSLAKDGKLQGVIQNPNGFGWQVTNSQLAIKSMKEFEAENV